jgi:hypothetical protein
MDNPIMYAPMPDYDQMVEYVTQADPVEQEDGSLFCDVVINPIALDEQDLSNANTVEILAIGYQNAASLGHDVSQDDIDTLQTAAEASGADKTQVAVISARLNSIAVISTKVGTNDMAKPSRATK